MRSAYPQRPPADPAVIERGRGLYSVNCAFCHGSDARGGEGGPNLIRSQLLLNDKNGEGITPVVQNGRPAAGMPKFNFTAAQVSDIAAFVHTIPVGGRDPARQPMPINIVVGDANAGKTFFDGKCASCHSAAGDLKGIASKITDAKTLQQTWMMPNAGRGGRGGPAPVSIPPTTVTVTLASGQKAEGRLVQNRHFVVSLTDAEGKLLSFPRKGDKPRVEVHDPMQPHLRPSPNLYRQGHPRCHSLPGNTQMKIRKTVCSLALGCLLRTPLPAQGLEPSQLLKPLSRRLADLLGRLLRPALQSAETDQSIERQELDSRVEHTR